MKNKLIKLLTPLAVLGILFSLNSVNSKQYSKVESATSSGTDWIRVTTVDGITSGDKYVIMGGAATKNVMESTNTGKFQNVTVLSSNTNASNLGANTIDDQQVGWILTAASKTGSFTIKSVKDGNYLYYTGSKNEVNYGTTQMDWTFTVNDGLFTVNNPAGRTLQYNSSAPRFATYTSNQLKLALYKYNPPMPPTLVSSISVSPGSASIFAGGTNNRTVQLSATVLPADATNKLYTWSSLNPSIASVSSTGLVTALSEGTATIRATAQDGSGVYGSAVITVINKTLVSITISGTPNKTEYNTGEIFDPTGITITGHYNNTDTIFIPLDEATYSPTPLSYGDTEVTVSWGGKSVVVSGISVSNIILTELEVTGTLEKSTYYNGDYFNPEGLVFTAYFSDDSSRELTYEELTFEPNPLSTGTTFVTATYVDKFVIIEDISVEDVVLNSISIKNPASKTNFKLGETFSHSGLVINANYNSGTIEKTSGFTVTGVDTMVLGHQTATVEFGGKTTSYVINVTNIGANAGHYENTPGSYNSLYSGSGMWTTTTSDFNMGSSYNTYNQAILSSTDSVSGSNWTISTGNFGTWGSGVTGTTGINLGVNSQTIQPLPNYISNMDGFSSLPNHDKANLYIGMNFNVTNPAKFSMKLITEKVMDAYIVYSTNNGSSYSILGNVHKTTVSDGSTWNEIEYAGQSSLGNSVRFGVLLLCSATSKIRTRVGDIGVYNYTPGSQSWVNGDFTPLEQATAFADFVNDGLGNNAKGNCEIVLEELLVEYNAMSEFAKEEFETNPAQKFIAARARIEYLESWVSAQQTSGQIREYAASKNNNVTAVATISVIGLTSLLGYYFLNKKKYTF